MIFYKKINRGFTLVELLVVISIIATLSTILFASFNDSREQARDKTRMADLKTLQLAVELYKAQNESYPMPDAGCGVPAGNFAGPGNVFGPVSLSTCTNYIDGLVPDFIPKLPTDPRFENENNQGFYYRSDGNSYKIIILDSVETNTVTSYSDEFARCPSTMGSFCPGTAPANTYGVYNAGAEDW